MKKPFQAIMKERWHFPQFNVQQVSDISSQLHLDPILVKLLLSRKIGAGQIEVLKHFINPSESLITDFDKITSKEDLEKATRRIKSAIDANEMIVVNGDPDADGITGTVIITAGLRHLGGRVHYDFPTRCREGHGLQTRIIDEAKQAGTKLIITSDCGSKDVESTIYANSQNIDVIICDHHILGREVPPAYAIVNPHRYTDVSFEKSLAGAGVAFKLVLAVFDTMKKPVPDYLMDFFLSVATLGTISDRMSFLNPLNRIMVKKGIEALNRTKMEGLRALKEVSSNGLSELRSNDIGRTIVPRLNAPGRIGDREAGIPDSRIVVDLLLLGMGKLNAQKASEVLEEFNYVLELDKAKKAVPSISPVVTDIVSALDEASLVEDINEKRKFMTSKIEDEIDNMVEDQVDVEHDRVIIVKGKNWNPGVIGIDADRLKDRFLRPAIIITEYTGSDDLRGSVRSIPTINMYALVDGVSDLFEKKHNRKLFQTEVETQMGKRVVNAFGGHAQACGFTLHKRDLDEFLLLIREAILTIPEDQFHFSYEVLESLELSQINSGLVKKLEQLTPYGQEFDYPVFFLGNCFVSKARPFGNKYQEARTPHLEFFVLNSHDQSGRFPVQHINAVGFGLWEKFCRIRSNDADARYDVIFTLEQFRRKGRKKFHDRLRMNVLDIRSSVESGQ